MAILGYDVDPQGGKLVVNDEEAQLVRAIYGLYLRHETLALVVQELAQRGWGEQALGDAQRARAGRQSVHQVHSAQAAHQRHLRRQGVLQARAAWATGGQVRRRSTRRLRG
jgi:hypothetical protein